MDKALRRECRNYFAGMSDAGPDRWAEYEEAVHRLVAKRANPDQVADRAQNSRNWQPARPVTPMQLADDWEGLK